ncbi:MAG: DUF1178 family protein [Burkholderiales bacterium]|nr:DUF1178 family protein [Burkholderiales bacterium]
MIVFELICDGLHRFEGWFASGAAFERQASDALIACPVCGSAEVRRVPSAKVSRPRVDGQPTGRNGTRTPEAQPGAAPRPVRSAAGQQISLAAFIDHVLANSEDVGERFAEEARRIHHAEAVKRSIRGQASREETEALLEEGIPVLPLPIPPKDEWQ